MFRDRQDAAQQLAKLLEGRHLEDPLVLAIPRGGVPVGAVLARELGADLDVVLARKLRAPFQPELAIGAVGEDGEQLLQEFAHAIPGVTDEYIARERAHQLGEIRRRAALFREARPAARVTRRSVIVTDDGIATGYTMMAALHVLGVKGAREIIVATPVAPPEVLEQLRPLCDRIVCVSAPAYFGAVGRFYDDFEQVEDREVTRLLREFQAQPH